MSIYFAFIESSLNDNSFTKEKKRQKNYVAMVKNPLKITGFLILKKKGKKKNKKTLYQLFGILWLQDGRAAVRGHQEGRGGAGLLPVQIPECCAGHAVRGLPRGCAASHLADLPGAQH